MAVTIKLSNTTFLETAPAGTVIGTLSLDGAASGEDTSYSWTLSDFFDVERDPETKEYQLVTKVEGKEFFDFENAALKEFAIKISYEDFDTGEVVESNFALSVTDDVSDNYNVITGKSKNDKITGTADADSIHGGAGNDKINGGAGDDIINGGTGKDILTGGAGMDTFVFDTPVKKGHFDQITDFKSADDTIQISLASLKAFKVKVAKQEVHDDLMGTKAGKKKTSFSLDKVFEKGKLEKKFFSIGKAKDSDDFVNYDKKTGFVYLDTDGSGKGQGIAIAKLKPGTSVTVDDFVFI
ncbi:hypothetical protein MHY87_13785 [Microvirga sp. ACRRW]|uniref:calcium-binding protein n=1 Tax=Microvirga sp. ACRRW TaxID=2918205 RepID=UPI001EF510EF|nr:calcium-binding protein [Microvirga sp. ACRRW]MCG7393977.1 hypothetical protein [Microvirga sp. ACRRW]